MEQHGWQEGAQQVVAHAAQQKNYPNCASAQRLNYTRERFSACARTREGADRMASIVISFFRKPAKCKLHMPVRQCPV